MKLSTFVKRMSFALLLFCGSKSILFAQRDTTPIQSHTIIGKMASFPGGPDSLQQFLKKNLKYPQSAKAANLQGSVVVQFVIKEDGKLLDPFIFRDLHPDCDQEALRLVKMMPDWEPAIQRGKPVRVQYNLPIRFELPQ